MINLSAQSLRQDIWVDSVFSTMNEDQRISQLLMIAAYSNKDEKHINKIKSQIKKYDIGGLMFLQGGPVRQANLTNLYQSISKVPLFIAQDSEWGLSMRLDSSITFPWQMTLGAIQDEKLVYKMGEEIARQCKLIGVNINFAPVLDVNFNPENPIIGNRSFGEDPKRVGELGIQYMNGLQDNNVLACAKHFPGHGDTKDDSHKSLPVINHSKERLNNVEILPFKMLIDKGLGSVMIAHLNVPSLDNTKDLAVSLSKNVVTDLLKDKLGFNGLVITDALNMKGVSEYYKPGIVDVKALLAGNDILLFSEDVDEAIKQIKLAIENNEITQSEIDERCKKILKTKYWMGLYKYKSLDISQIKDNLINNYSKFLNRDLVENSITLLQNYNDILPLKRLDTLKIACLSIGDEALKLKNTLSKYSKIDNYTISDNISLKERSEIISRLNNYNLIIVSVHKSNLHPWKSYKIDRDVNVFIQKLSKNSNVILNIFANPYSLNSLSKVNNFNAVVMSYQNSDISQEMSAQAIFGGISFKGRLPVSTKHYDLKSGFNSSKVRLKYTMSEEFNVNSKDLYRIDSLVNSAIKNGATPGCQILIAKKGKVVYEKSFGYHTYFEKQQVDNLDVYDLASITKIASTVPLLMKMVDDNFLDIDKSLGDYLSLESTNKENLLIRDVLAHQAGLKSWIPFYQSTLSLDTNTNTFNFIDSLYSDSYSKDFPYNVAKNLFLNKSYKDSIYKTIVNSDLRLEKSYKYSDIGYYLFQELIEEYFSSTIDKLIDSIFYRKLGMDNLGYHPLKRLDISRIIPTEYDSIFRKQLIHGYVHDQGAAMLGGVGGHAGLFSNANDLAKLMQMFLNFGTYGGESYIQQSTLLDFIRCQYCNKDNRRGAGFDRPANHGKPGPTCDSVSFNSFGHTGFTGTICWADIDNEIIYIFLSNRVYPDSSNMKLIRQNVRTNIMQEIYNHFGNN